MTTATSTRLLNFRPTPAPAGETWNVEQWDLFPASPVSPPSLVGSRRRSFVALSGDTVWKLTFLVGPRGPLCRCVPEEDDEDASPARARMRLFFAIELPADVREALGGFRLAESSEYRWVDPSLLHVTLAFLGQQPEERLETLERVGSAAANASRAAVLRLGRAGSFGPRREPRVLWVGLDGDVPALLALQARLARELRGAGFELEDRAVFAAHHAGPPPRGRAIGWPAGVAAREQRGHRSHSRWTT